MSPSRSIPESSDEDGDAGMPASATRMPSGSQPTPSNSSHTSEVFLKGKPWWPSSTLLTAQSSAKVEVALWLGVTRESVLSIDVVGLRRGGHEYDMGRRGDAQGERRMLVHDYICGPSAGGRFPSLMAMNDIERPEQTQGGALQTESAKVGPAPDLRSWATRSSQSGRKGGKDSRYNSDDYNLLGGFYRTYNLQIKIIVIPLLQENDHANPNPSPPSLIASNSCCRSISYVVYCGKSIWLKPVCGYGLYGEHPGGGEHQ